MATTVSFMAGLSAVEAEHRLRQWGPNEIRRESSVTALTLLWRQFNSPVIWLLVAASAVSLALGELVDAGAIAAIVTINAAIGFLQEQSCRASGARTPLDDCPTSEGHS